MDGDATTTSAQPTLNLKQVALHLGVHYMTAYRYVRQGRLDAVRVGTEWRVAPDELERFEARRASMPTDPADASVRRTDERAAMLRHRLVAGDELAAWSVLEDALTSGVPADACFELIGSALAGIGDDATDLADPDGPGGPRSIADQHIAVAMASRLVVLLGARCRRPGRTRGDIVVGAPTGEHHGLPIAIVSGLLRLHRFGVLELGADAPPEAFVVAASRCQRLVAVCIGVTRVESVEAATTVCRLVKDARPGTPVFVGGQAVRNELVAGAIGADGWSAAGSDLADLIAAHPRR